MAVDAGRSAEGRGAGDADGDVLAGGLVDSANDTFFGGGLATKGRRRGRRCGWGRLSRRCGKCWGSNSMVLRCSNIGWFHLGHVHVKSPLFQP